MPSYSYEKQVKNVIATVTLHNYRWRHAHFFYMGESLDERLIGGIEIDVDA